MKILIYNKGRTKLNFNNNEFHTNSLNLNVKNLKNDYITLKLFINQKYIHVYEKIKFFSIIKFC